MQRAARAGQTGPAGIRQLTGWGPSRRYAGNRRWAGCADASGPWRAVCQCAKGPVQTAEPRNFARSGSAENDRSEFDQNELSLSLL
eukprot:7390074-Prymnesium_polylepis.1